MLTTALALTGLMLASEAGPGSAHRTTHPSHTASRPTGSAPAASTTTTISAAESHPGAPAGLTRSAATSSATTSGSASVASVAGPPTAGVVPTVVAAPVSNRIEHGWLSGPTAISASYSLSAASPRQVIATWTGAPVLTLTVACDGTSRSVQGSSGLQLTAQGSTCWVTLSGPPDVATSSFALDLGPA